MPRDIGIANRLRARGLNVVEIDGWPTRGSETFNPRGSVDHHTAGGMRGNAPSLGICINGRSDLPGPLCNVLVGRDNTCYVIAAGRANHAGAGGWRGITGNSSVYGVERENRGTGEEPWREDQRQTAALVHAALLEGNGISAEMNCQHKEWATPPGRKVDVRDQDGNDMRNRIAAVMGQPPPHIPTNPQPTPPASNTLRVGSRGDAVVRLQNDLNFVIGAGLKADGIFGSGTKAAVVKFQKTVNISADGVAGPVTLDRLVKAKAEKERPKPPAPTPTGESEVDRIKQLQLLFGITPDGKWGPITSRACQRNMIGWGKSGMQGNNKRELVRWLQRQGNRKFQYQMVEDGLVGPATNHLIVVGLGQRDGICGPNGFRKAVQ